MKNIILILVLSFTGFATQAQDSSVSNHTNQKKSKNARYTTEVNGNCEQCQKRIQKAAFSVSGVKSANWSIETHQLSLILNEEKGTLLDVKKAVAKIGHDTDVVKATKDDYDSLHSCCKYERL
ncbi:heavy-metal-associated domain-containing protein [Flavobacterium sp. XS2P39]|uniref:heavy-metal-associated domain-containing protein n=1 Tax=Flavobacterium sp. XS2P39 TaxID=3401725 RepID=UPI003AABFFB2